MFSSQINNSKVSHEIKYEIYHLKSPRLNALIFIAQILLFEYRELLKRSSLFHKINSPMPSISCKTDGKRNLRLTIL